MTPTLDGICAVVAAEFNLQPGHLKGPNRKRRFSVPRQIAFMMAYDLTAHSYPDIARHFKRKCHKTIIHGVVAARDRSQHPSLQPRVDRIRRTLTADPFVRLLPFKSSRTQTKEIAE